MLDNLSTAESTVLKYLPYYLVKLALLPFIAVPPSPHPLAEKDSEYS
jgi:hypothetical protein